MRGLPGSHASRHASAWVKVYSIVPLCFAIYLLCMSCVSASPTGIMEARHGGHDDETPASSFTSTQTAASLSVSQIPAAQSSTARLSSPSVSSMAPSSSMAPVSLTTHDAEHGHVMNMDMKARAFRMTLLRRSSGLRSAQCQRSLINGPTLK